MNFVARAAVVVCASVLAGVAGAAGAGDRPQPLRSAGPATATPKGDAAPVRSDRLERDFVERETKRRSAAKPPVMPAERS